MKRLTLWAAVLVALALGVATARVVQAEPGLALAGPEYAGLAVLLLPGWSLIAVGLVSWWRRQEVQSSLWFTAAGATWFLAEWNNPAAGSSIAFTLGLVLYAATPAFIAHGVLAYPTGRTDRRQTALLLAGDVVTILGIGLLPAMLADPATAGCVTCPGDLVAAFDAPDLARDATRVGLLLGAGWALVAAATVVGRVVWSGPLRRARAGVSAAAATYLVLVAADWLRTVGSNSLNVDPTQRWLHALEGLALVALAAAVAWGWTHRRRTRARVARLVLELDEAPPPGGLSDVLAASLGDSTLQVGYWLANGGLVDVTGQPVEVSGAATPLVRSGRQVALVTHRPGLLGDPRVADEVAAAARLAMESERLQAELRAQLEHLRASRQRIVAAADAARQRLERDLHDGAQQQLVGLLLRLRLHRAGWPTGVHSAVAARAAEVEAELEAAVDDLRELAHGLYPSVLAEEGLAPAVEDFAEGADVPVILLGLPEQRLPAAVESAGYVVVAEAIRRGGARAASVRVQTEAGRLVVDLTLSAAVADGGWVTALEDRVGALDGTLTVRRDDVEDLAVRAVIPCAL